ncbi:Polyprenyl synthetase [Pseudopedobacter saltans DSM 12145]|uniref:Polyprenyl synthetase n=1 Tax=Pseudopedobacter saltans (strain ATCC 51119 / DSM 12145 / JCM 21818 / CCUG 39354 / LMG 10337 / NBRC 100064 / NCIMB 13643) TaxID=762903 RepID=F0SDR5_PSESL|nr:polyprenyl synthetase family protein [Pseudopedobacter saltans]ADY51811.1 Polyprenyl synthetase [Pseudopedobacter saltans DSM 12145]
MYKISELQLLLDQEINTYSYPSSPRNLYEPVSYLLGLGGKRLRPALLLLATDLFGGDVEKAVKPAMAIEFFHNFSLMHDDIMDKAPLRRGKPTVHEKWSDSTAILSGDIMLIEAYKLICEVEAVKLPACLKIFNTISTEVCEGQQMDMNFEKEEFVSIEEYIEMIRLKTAVLLGGALKIGAVIADASENDQELINDFGTKLGVAFQLQDDILDVYGDPEKFGKQVGGDIISNKKTFLLIKALELAKDDLKKELEDLLNNQIITADDKVAQVTAIYNTLNIRKIAEEKMLNYAAEALHCLEKINVPTERKEVLRDFASKLITRDK